MGRSQKLFSIAMISIILSLCILTGCEKEATRPPVTGSISGQVTFTGTPPESGNVQVSAFAVWDTTGGFNGATGPPSGWTEPLAVGETITYEITGLAIPGTYQAVVVGWRDPNVPGSDVVLGMYGAHKAHGDTTPVSISLTEENHSAAGVDFVADFGELAEDSVEGTGSISGTINFTGTWPAGQPVYVMASENWPIRGPGPMYGPLPQGTSADYTIPNVPFGEYRVVGVWTYPAMTFLGAYGYVPAASDTIPDPVTINTSSPNAVGINFEAVFP